MRKFLLSLLFGTLTFLAQAQEPSSNPRNIQVNRYLSTFQITYQYTQPTNATFRADSFVVFLSQYSNPDSTCMAVDAVNYRVTAGKSTSWSSMQNLPCAAKGANSRVIKFRANNTLAGTYTDTFTISCIDTQFRHQIALYAGRNNSGSPNYRKAISPNTSTSNSAGNWRPDTAVVQSDSVPTFQVSNVSVSNIGTSSLTLNWKNGSGDSVLIFAVENTSSTATFTDPSTYVSYSSLANPNFMLAGSGPGGAKVIYAGGITSRFGNQALTVTGLSNSPSATRYHFIFYSFNQKLCSGCSFARCPNTAYNVSTPPTINSKLRPVPPSIAPSNLNILSVDSFNVTFDVDLPVADSFIVVFRNAPSTLPNLPTRMFMANDDSSSINYGTSWDTLVNSSQVVVYKNATFGSGTKTLDVTELKQDKDYTISVYAYNSNGAGFESYNATAASASFFTDATRPLNCPIVTSGTPSLNSSGGVKFFDFTLTWTPGIGSNRTLVIASQNGPITATPVDFSQYPNIDQFGLGTELAPDEYVVYSGGDSVATITSIPRIGPSTPLYYKLFSYNGTHEDFPGSMTGNMKYNISCLSQNATLPVSFISFNAVSTSTGARLIWSTASEQRNAGFKVETSVDGINWSEIGFVKGFGNSVTRKDYSFNHDFSAAASNQYYRLNQIDFDGKSTLSKVVLIKFIQKEQLQVFPIQNPVNTTLRLPIMAPSSVDFEIRITRIDGVVVKQFSHQLSSNGIIDLEVSDLFAGVYVFTVVRSDGHTHFGKFVKD